MTEQRDSVSLVTQTHKEGLAQAAFSQEGETAVIILEMKHAEELLNQNYKSSPEPFFFANMIIKPPKTSFLAMNGWTTCLTC